MSFTLSWMAHRAHVRYFEDLDMRRHDERYVRDYGPRLALTLASGCCERDTPVGRISVYVRVFEGFRSGMRRHTREIWKLDGKRISLAKLSVLLQPFEPLQVESGPLQQDRRPIGNPVSCGG